MKELRLFGQPKKGELEDRHPWERKSKMAYVKNESLFEDFVLSAKAEDELRIKSFHSEAVNLAQRFYHCEYPTVLRYESKSEENVWYIQDFGVYLSVILWDAHAPIAVWVFGFSSGKITEKLAYWNNGVEVADTIEVNSDFCSLKLIPLENFLSLKFSENGGEEMTIQIANW